ncbi:alanine racemase [Candidatus Sumerlaeota bacterium]|nr:alanine racemase [Candidatus Sumerlaeota bacterium]
MRLEDYIVAKPDEIETPALLAFEDKLEFNIQKTVELAGGAQNLTPHVKTHKSAYILQRQMAAGIKAFKCATLKEAEMIAEQGASEILLSYPLAQYKKAQRFVGLQKKYPRIKWFALASSPQHLEIMAKAASESGSNVSVMVDLDVGMHRTGIDPGEPAYQLCVQISKTPGLKFGGLHAYDGHNEQTDLTEREAAANKALSYVRELESRLRNLGFEEFSIVMGGSPCFPYYAREKGIKGSPGTTVYWDGGYSQEMPDMPFRCCALVLTQVIDENPALGLITLDLGSKAICSDKPLPVRATFPSYPNLKIVRQNEEHLVLEKGDYSLSIGDYLLAIPRHVCTAVVRYPGAWLIDKHGNVTKWIEHTARDR